MDDSIKSNEKDATSVYRIKKIEKSTFRNPKRVLYDCIVPIVSLLPVHALNAFQGNFNK